MILFLRRFCFFLWRFPFTFSHVQVASTVWTIRGPTKVRLGLQLPQRILLIQRMNSKKFQTIQEWPSITKRRRNYFGSGAFPHRLAIGGDRGIDELQLPRQFMRINGHLMHREQQRRLIASVIEWGSRRRRSCSGGQRTSLSAIGQCVSRDDNPHVSIVSGTCLYI